MWNLYTVLVQIHSGNCLQKIGILDLSLIKLLQNEQGCNFFVSQCRFALIYFSSFKPDTEKNKSNFDAESSKRARSGASLPTISF